MALLGEALGLGVLALCLTSLGPSPTLVTLATLPFSVTPAATSFPVAATVFPSHPATLVPAPGDESLGVWAVGVRAGVPESAVTSMLGVGGDGAGVGDGVVAKVELVGVVAEAALVGEGGTGVRGGEEGESEEALCVSSLASPSLTVSSM